MIRYRVYPTLLDEFGRFKRGSVSKENLLNRINRIRDFDEKSLKRMRKGVAFENAVLKNTISPFDPEIITETRNLLPKIFASQYAVQFLYEEVLFYGYADVVGERRVIDLKITANFVEDKYLNSFQNLYLYGLKDKGCKTMEYIVYDFKNVHHLIYNLNDIDFQPFLEDLSEFCVFLEENRKDIIDKKIFLEAEGGLF